MTLPDPDTMLELRDVAAGYGPLQVLFGVSLSVRQGEIVALMGSNGAGKTTTMRSIVGLLPLMGGSVHAAGADVSGHTPERLVSKGVVLVPEGRGMLRDLSVADNLALGAHTVRSSAAVSAALDQAYTTFPILYERRQQLAGTLSGGQQQMLALGRALMSQPRMLLVDEASLGLSPVMTETVFTLLSKVNSDAGVAILLVEQNVLALDLAARAYLLEKGQVVSEAVGPEVRRMQNQLRDAYLGKASA